MLPVVKPHLSKQELLAPGAAAELHNSEWLFATFFFVVLYNLL